MMQCIMCPEGKCPEDCPARDVLPYERSSRQESIQKARKITAIGIKVEDIKNQLKEAGSVEAKNDLINKWIADYDSAGDKNAELYEIIRCKIIMIKQDQLLAEQRKLLAEKQSLVKAARAVLEDGKALYQRILNDPSTTFVVDDDDESAPAVADGPSSPKD